MEAVDQALLSAAGFLTAFGTALVCQAFDPSPVWIAIAIAGALGTIAALATAALLDHRD